MHIKLLQLCPTRCHAMDYNQPGSSVYGIFQARLLEWIAISFYRGIFQTQGLNPHLLRVLNWQADSLSLALAGKTVHKVRLALEMRNLTQSNASKSKSKKIGPKQLKNFCREEETINRVKRQSMEWEKIVVNYETDNSLISKIYEKFLQLINKTKQNKTYNSIEKHA